MTEPERVMRSWTSGLGSAATLLSLMILAGPVKAEDAPVIQFDPLIRAFSSPLPYRTPFTLDVPAARTTLSVAVWFWSTGKRATDCGARATSALHLSGKPQPVTGDATEKHFQVAVPALRADTAYCVSIDLVTAWTAEQSARAASAITENVVKLVISGSIKLDALVAAVGSALGPDANLVIVNRPGTVTVAQALGDILWGPHKSPALATLEKQVKSEFLCECLTGNHGLLVVHAAAVSCESSTDMSR